MAKDKSKDEVKADIVDQEIANTTIEEVKAIDPVSKEKLEHLEEVDIKLEGENNGNTQKNDKATSKTSSQKEVKHGAASPAKAKKTKQGDGQAEPVTESKMTEAAIDVAQQEGVVIAAKRTTAVVAGLDDDSRKTVAKAGKRSVKAIKEAEEKEAKEERKAKAAEQKTEDKPKVVKQRTAEDRLKARGKNFRKAAEMVDNDKDYNLKEALELAVKTSLVKFDATVELHINLGVDPKHADQNVRGNLVLPAGTGKSIRVAVLADDAEADKAKKAGADIAGHEELLAALEKGVIEFDTLIAAPAMMSKLGKYARTLGPKGLMPNPKSGTVTTDVVKAVKEAKAGKLEYRVDSTGIVHVGFGKVSFGADKLAGNASAILASIKAAKPASVKGNYVKAIHITTSMGPGIRVATAEAN